MRSHCVGGVGLRLTSATASEARFLSFVLGRWGTNGKQVSALDHAVKSACLQSTTWGVARDGAHVQRDRRATSCLVGLNGVRTEGRGRTVW